MYCTKCGAKLLDEALFCTKCGQKVTRADGAVKTPVTAVPKMEAPKAEEFDEWPEDEPKLRKAGLPVLIGIIVIVLCIIAVLCIYLVLGKERGEDTTSRLEELSEEVEDDGNAEDKDGEQASKEAVSEEEISELLSEGCTMLSDEDYAGAQSIYEEAKALNSASEQVYMFGADVYLKQGDFSSALAVLEEGSAESSSENLTARAEYIRKNVVFSKIKSENGSTSWGRKYDEYGNVIDEDSYNEFYELTGWKEYEYNTTGNKIRSLLFEEDGDLDVKTSYVYDSDGRLSAEINYNAEDKFKGRYEYVYDSEGRQVKCIQYNEKGKVEWTTESEYDSTGKKIKDSGYDKKGKLGGWVETEYNANGDAYIMTRYDKKGNVIEWVQNEYNANGELVTISVYGEDDELQYKTETEYGANGYKVKDTRYNPDGTVYSWCEYDEIGKKSREWNEKAGEVYVYEYKYIGDILCEGGVTPVSGRITLSQPAGYRRIANAEAAYVGIANANEAYTVVGETDNFYRVKEGWYFAKTQNGLSFAVAE